MGSVNFWLKMLVMEEKRRDIRMASKTPIRSNTTPFSPSFFKSKSESKSVFLHDWWLVKPQQQCKGLAIGGVTFSMERERVFLSTVIAKRHEANVVESEDGIVIMFRGFVNASRTIQNGFSSEVCSNFLLGFPHDWKNYLVHSARDECEYLNGVNVSDDSNASAHKTIDETLPFSIPDNNEVVPPKEICNGGGSSFGESSKQSESTGNMECAIDSMTTEAKDKDKDNMGNLKLSQPQVDVIYNGENGVSDVVAFDSPVSIEKLKNDQLSSDRKKKKHIRQKIVEDTGGLCSRVVTRSTSNRSYSKVKKDEKVKENSFGKSFKQSESTDNMECGIDMVTIEVQDKDNTGNLELSRPQVDMIYNGENGVSDVVAVESPVSAEKLKNDQLSYDRKKKHIRQKIVEDTGGSCSGVVTRSTSNRSRTELKKDEKVKDNSFGKNSKQFESTDNMECGLDTMTIEAEDKNNMGNLELSRPQVDMIYDGANGISDVEVESPVSTKKLKNNQLLSDCKEKKHIRQKIVENTGDSCSTVVTGSTSKRRLTKVEKVKEACVSGPVRRSPRLLKSKMACL